MIKKKNEYAFYVSIKGRQNAKYLPNLLIFLLETQKATFFSFLYLDWVGPLDSYLIVY